MKKRNILLMAFFTGILLLSGCSKELPKEAVGESVEIAQSEEISVVEEAFEENMSQEENGDMDNQKQKELV